MTTSIQYQDLLLKISNGDDYAAGSKSKLTKVERSKLNYAIANQSMETESNFPFFIFSEKCSFPDLQSESLTVNGREVGRTSSKGCKSYMEDFDIAQTFEFLNHKAEIYAVFDGHGGEGVALFLKNNIVSFLIKGFEACKQLDEEDIWNALKSSFKSLNEQCTAKGGSTAAVALIINDTLWVANVGDSRIILNKNGKAVAFTEDAHPDFERYRRKVVKAGGTVSQIYPYKGYYVNDQYGNARAFGDKESTGISAAPKITFLPLENIRGGQLILASDGIFDVCSSGQAVRGIEKNKEASAEEMSKLLVDSAIKSHAQDNVTAMVVKF